MLRSLEIRDLLIIDRLELAFEPGLNVLTGETGAGKSILLDALGFVLGWRGRAELVRQGADQGEVIAVFELGPGHPARSVLEDAGLVAGDELILRRINTAEGRKTAWVNDRRASGEVLRALSDTLVELHGQQDDRGLLNPRNHREMLDLFGDLGRHRALVRQAWSALSAARRQLTEAEAEIEAMRREEADLRNVVSDLLTLDPQPGEDAELSARRSLMKSAKAMGDQLASALAALSYDGGAGGQLQQALQNLGGVAEDALAARIDPMVEMLDSAASVVSDVEGALESLIADLEFDATDMTRTEDRFFALREMARKYRVEPDELPNLLTEAQSRLARIESSTGDLENLQTARSKAEATYDKAAAELSKARGGAARRLDTAMAGELAPLKMERAAFETSVVTADPGPDGVDAVTFVAATNPGAPAGALNKIASGGELSRFLLALKVCLSGSESGLTMIFDEIDRGVGGATADAVGRRLADLAQGGQVLVVTHSPQVAARGAHHWRVQKQVDAGHTLSTVVPLPEEDRVDEIARMLSGDTITDEARSAARALLIG